MSRGVPASSPFFTNLTSQFIIEYQGDIDCQSINNSHDSKARHSFAMYIPPEITSAILYHQSKTELKKARLVSKAFDAAAVPFLFEEIFVFARYADMEKATLIASRFGHFVKTLIFCSESFEPGISWNHFKATMGGSHLARSYYYSYCKLRDEQEELRKGGEFFGHLCSILILLSNLQKVVLTNMCDTQGLCWCHQVRTFRSKPSLFGSKFGSHTTFLRTF